MSSPYSTTLAPGLLRLLHVLNSRASETPEAHGTTARDLSTRQQCQHDLHAMHAVGHCHGVPRAAQGGRRLPGTGVAGRAWSVRAGARVEPVLLPMSRGEADL